MGPSCRCPGRVGYPKYPPGVYSASTFPSSSSLPPPSPLPCLHCFLLFHDYPSVVGSNRWYSIALSFAFGALADVHHKGSTPTKLNAFIRLRAVAHNWHGAQIVSTVTTSREKAVVAKTCLLNPLGRLDVYRTNLQLFIPALCPSGFVKGHNFANWQAQAAF